MDNKCPKCGRKLSVWYIKQNCPDCNCDLLYYNMDKRLDADAEKAEAEFAAWERIKNKVTPSFLKKREEK